MIIHKSLIFSNEKKKKVIRILKNNYCMKSEQIMRNLTLVIFIKLWNSTDDGGKSESLSRVKNVGVKENTLAPPTIQQLLRPHWHNQWKTNIFDLAQSFHYNPSTHHETKIKLQSAFDEFNDDNRRLRNAYVNNSIVIENNIYEIIIAGKIIRNTYGWNVEMSRVGFLKMKFRSFTECTRMNCYYSNCCEIFKRTSIYFGLPKVPSYRESAEYINR